jgi:hypothetical protein
LERVGAFQAGFFIKATITKIPTTTTTVIMIIRVEGIKRNTLNWQLFSVNIS